MAAVRPTQGASSDTWGTELNAWLDETLAGTTQVLVVATGNITLSGTQTVDGVALIAGDICLVPRQTASATNGVYVVNAGAWTRHTLFDTSAKIAGGMVRVEAGTVNAGTRWATSFSATATLGTTAMLWFQIADLGTDYETGQPASPPQGLTMFSRYRARRIPAFVGPTGQDSRLQPALFSNNVAWMRSLNNSTTPAVNGLAVTWLNNATSTPTAVAAASTNFYSSMVRTRVVTPAANNSGAGARVPTAQWFLSTTANMGGFYLVVRWGLATVASGTRGFIGMTSQTAAYAAGTDPSAQLTQIGFHWNAAQTTLRFIVSGTAAGTAVDLGANFPVTASAATYLYESSIFCPAGLGQHGFWSTSRVNDGLHASGTFGTSGGSGGTTIPAIGTLLTPQVFYGSGTQSAAQSMDIQSIYIESDN